MSWSGSLQMVLFEVETHLAMSGVLYRRLNMCISVRSNCCSELFMYKKKLFERPAGFKEEARMPDKRYFCHFYYLKTKRLIAKRQDSHKHNISQKSGTGVDFPKAGDNFNLRFFSERILKRLKFCLGCSNDQCSNFFNEMQRV